jgi:hypothetical protein
MLGIGTGRHLSLVTDIGVLLPLSGMSIKWFVMLQKRI